MIDLDEAPKSLLTAANPKLERNEELGYITRILHLAPARVSGHNVCIYATPGCSSACLNTAGRGGIVLRSGEPNMIQAARIRRTRFLRRDRKAFLTMLGREIVSLQKLGQKHNKAIAVRLNGTSDLRWERIPFPWAGRTYRSVMELFDDVSFYDYTKIPIPERGARIDGLLPENYSLTFSLSEHNVADARKALELGTNVAVVFRSPDFPSMFKGYRVISGDEHDLRFLDPTPAIVALKAKGKALKDDTRFVQDRDDNDEESWL